ncbi:VanZ family protein [Kordia jejudonensis]|uniref:VanZ family protein n=1 Tax=Kordia jejudonensis TaxID=1348245 RepID=UPI0012E0542D|nr:VanZ family protein [Kordia jejudonensis]
MHKYIFSSLAIVLTLLITFLSLASIEDGPPLPFSFADKLIHGIFYFTFAISWFIAFTKGKTTPFLSKNALIVSVSFAIIYGIVMEIFQATLVENRQGDWQDALANAVGAIVAGILIKYFISHTIKLKMKN